MYVLSSKYVHIWHATITTCICGALEVTFKGPPHGMLPLASIPDTSGVNCLWQPVRLQVAQNRGPRKNTH